MTNQDKKWKRQPNQFKILQDEFELTEGAERLLALIKKYQYTHKVTVQQYAYLMGISKRNTIKYINELLTKKRIEIISNRIGGRGKANKYLVIEMD